MEVSVVTTAETAPVDIEIDLTDAGAPVEPSSWGPGTVIQVGIVDEHEMFALGLRTSLAASPLVKVSPVVDEDVDVVIVSPQAAGERRFHCPVIVCGELPNRLAPGNQVMAVLGRSTLTREQLLASIHAAAAGLSDKIEIRLGDALEQPDLASMTVVFLYMGDHFNLLIRPYLWKQLPVGARVVSHRFLMGDWKPDKTVTVSDDNGLPYELHLWTITEAHKRM